jgi:hypothetical protein
LEESVGNNLILGEGRHQSLLILLDGLDLSVKRFNNGRLRLNIGFDLREEFIHLRDGPVNMLLEISRLFDVRLSQDDLLLIFLLVELLLDVSLAFHDLLPKLCLKVSDSSEKLLLEPHNLILHGLCLG